MKTPGFNHGDEIRNSLEKYAPTCYDEPMNESRGHMIHILPTPQQERELRRAIGANRWLWNSLIAWIRDDLSGTYPGRMACDRRMLSLKNQHEWLRAVPSQSLQQTLIDLDRGYRDYEKLKNRKDLEREKPKFHRRGKNESFRLPQHISVDVLRKRIKLPKVGELRTRQSLDFGGKLRNVTIKREGAKWFAVLGCEHEFHPIPTSEYLNSSVGIDRGIAHSVATSDGVFFDMPDLKPLYARKAGLQRFLKRKKKGSSRYRKLQHSIALLDARIANIRRDFLQKTSTILAKNHGHIVLEDLKVQSMMRSARGTVENPGKNVAQKRGLNREVGRQGWSILRFFLDYKLRERGGILELVSARNSSRECSECGHIAAENRPSQARFECQSCGHEENADINAARVIRGRALSRDGSARCEVSKTRPMTRIPTEILVLN
jgi:putative transposase